MLFAEYLFAELQLVTKNLILFITFIICLIFRHLRIGTYNLPQF